MRGGRRRAKHLLLPGGEHRQHTDVHQSLSRHEDIQARAKLPLHPNHCKRSQQPHRKEPIPDTQRSLLEKREGRFLGRLPRLQRRGGRRNRGQQDTRTPPTPTICMDGLRHPLPHQRAKPHLRGSLAQTLPALPHLRGAILLPTQGNQRCHRLLPPHGQPLRRRSPEAHHQLSTAGHWQHHARQNHRNGKPKQCQPLGSTLPTPILRIEFRQGHRRQAPSLPSTDRKLHPPGRRTKRLRSGDGNYPPVGHHRRHLPRQLARKPQPQGEHRRTGQRLERLLRPTVGGRQHARRPLRFPLRSLPPHRPRHGQGWQH